MFSTDSRSLNITLQIRFNLNSTITLGLYGKISGIYICSFPGNYFLFNLDILSKARCEMFSVHHFINGCHLGKY